MFSLYNFSSIFPGDSSDPIYPYVRTPMPSISTLLPTICLDTWSGAPSCTEDYHEWAHDRLVLSNIGPNTCTK